MLPTWYQFNFPKQVTLKGHRQENTSYNFPTWHFFIVIFSMRKHQMKVHSQIEYILLYGQPTKKRNKQTNKKTTERRRKEKSELHVREKNPTQCRCCKKVNNDMEIQG